MQEIRGYIYNIIYRNEENAYTVFEVETEEDRITCVGFPPAISQGEGCRLTGEYTSHPVYGDQFRVREYRMVPPETTQAMFRYLSSGAVKGIGAALARRIIRAFGEETIRIMNEEPERLSEVKGISDRKAREIAAQLEGKKDLQDAMLFLQNYGIGSRQALKIWKTYGIRLYSVLKENPYRLAEDIRGIGFLTADQIAARLGIRPDSEFRIRSGILYTMSQALAEGSTWLPMETVLSRTAGLLGLPAEELGVHLTNLIVDRKLRSKVREGTGRSWTAPCRWTGEIWIRTNGSAGWKKKKASPWTNCRGRRSAWLPTGPCCCSQAVPAQAKRPPSIRSSIILRRRIWMSCWRPPRAGRPAAWRRPPDGKP